MTARDVLVLGVAKLLLPVSKQLPPAVAGADHTATLLRTFLRYSNMFVLSELKISMAQSLRLGISKAAWMKKKIR